jgi:IS4 transposase
VDEQTIASFVADHSVVGATGAAALAFLYKIWRVIKVDSKGDNLDNAERAFRDEIRSELKELRLANEKLHEVNEKLQKDKRDCESLIAELQTRLKWLEVCFCQCQQNHPHDCPLKHIWNDTDHSDRRTATENRRGALEDSGIITPGRRTTEGERRNEDQ